MVAVAQLVRASVCGTEGRGFEPRQSPLLGCLSMRKNAAHQSVLRRLFVYRSDDVDRISREFDDRHRKLAVFVKHASAAHNDIRSFLNTKKFT